MSDPLEPQALYLTATSIQRLVEHLGELFIVMFLVKSSYYSSQALYLPTSPNKGSVKHLGELFIVMSSYYSSQDATCVIFADFLIHNKHSNEMYAGIKNGSFSLICSYLVLS